MTIGEAFATGVAAIKSILFGGAPADYMSPELEELLCTNDVLGRHRIVYPLTNERLGEMPDSELRALIKQIKRYNW
jgi:hypothetical protein